MRPLLVVCVLAMLGSQALAADDYPTDKDLKAAYCHAAIQALLPGDPEGVKIDKRMLGYLMARGYFTGQKEPLLLLPALNQGATDAHSSISIGSNCESLCSGEGPQCLTACTAASDKDGVMKRLASCSDLLQSLPF